MAKRNSGVLFILLFGIEVVLSLAYGYSEPFGHVRAERAAQEYVQHRTPQNKAAMEEEWERVYAPQRRRNRIILAVLAANSCLLVIVAYRLARMKS